MKHRIRQSSSWHMSWCRGRHVGDILQDTWRGGDEYLALWKERSHRCGCPYGHLRVRWGALAVPHTGQRSKLLHSNDEVLQYVHCDLCNSLGGILWWISNGMVSDNLIAMMQMDKLRDEMLLIVMRLVKARKEGILKIEEWNKFLNGDAEQSMHVVLGTANTGERQHLQSIAPLSLWSVWEVWTRC